MKSKSSNVLLRDLRIHKIIEGALPDDIGISAREYNYAGWEYETGAGVEQPDKKLAIKCYEKAIEMGLPEAMLSMARLYRKTNDMDNAYKWTLEAALSLKSGRAYLELGKLYFEGEYVEQDYRKAYKYLEMAYQMEEETSEYYMGYYAEFGLIEAPDRDKAVEYYLEGSKICDYRCWMRLDELNVDYEIGGQIDVNNV